MKNFEFSDGWVTKFHFSALYAVFCIACGAQAMLLTLQASANMPGLSNARSTRHVRASEVILGHILHQLLPDAFEGPW